jgi:hypothetical protein
MTIPTRDGRRGQARRCGFPPRAVHVDYSRALWWRLCRRLSVRNDAAGVPDAYAYLEELLTECPARTGAEPEPFGCCRYWDLLRLRAHRGRGWDVIEKSWFGESPTVGELSDDEKAAYLRAVGDPGAPPVAEATESAERARLWFMDKRPFEHTGSAVGYIQSTDDQYHPLVDPREVAPERGLIGTKVALRLTQALVVRYPGSGTHEILLHFGVGGGSEAVPKHDFGSTIRCADGNQMPLGGQRLFEGVEIGEEGLNIGMFTVNVHSQGDVQLLQALQSEVFQKGLDLVASVGPVVGLLSVTLASLARHIASSSQNRPVQQGLLALDLDRTLVDSAKLRLGTYVLAQAPAQVDGRPWSWNAYVYDRARNAIVCANDHDRLIPFNYVAVGIQSLRG